VVTSSGILIPLCGDVQPAKITFGLAPLADVDAQQEVIKIAAETMGILESWRAYPALYALLHPDVKAATSFPAVACWYANQYGTIDAPVGDGITATAVTATEHLVTADGQWRWFFGLSQAAFAA